MTMKKAFFLLIITLVSFSCKSSEPTIVDPELFGTWTWLSTDGGIGNHIHDTPENSELKFQLKLRKDMRYNLFVNTKKTESGRFEITHQKSLLQNKEATFITVDENPNDTGNIVLSGLLNLEQPDTLIISQDVYDGVGSTFKKVK